MAGDAPEGMIVNWEKAKVCLAELAREAPAFLNQAVVIGGAACWFYRHLLAKADDPDFRVPDFNAREEGKWLSKDIDFTNVFAEDARKMLASKVRQTEDGRPGIMVVGVPIGFAQVGVTFDPESAWENAWVAGFDAGGKKVECKVLDPVRLYLEKTALVQRRGAEGDRLHLRTLEEFLRLEVCRQAEGFVRGVSLRERTEGFKFLTEVGEKAQEVCKDERVGRRIGEALRVGVGLTAAERRALEKLLPKS